MVNTPFCTAYTRFAEDTQRMDLDDGRVHALRSSWASIAGADETSNKVRLIQVFHCDVEGELQCGDDSQPIR